MGLGCGGRPDAARFAELKNKAIRATKSPHASGPSRYLARHDSHPMRGHRATVVS